LHRKKPEEPEEYTMSYFKHSFQPKVVADNEYHKVANLKPGEMLANILTTRKDFYSNFYSITVNKEEKNIQIILHH
jgi:hypothetical protein